METGYLLCLVPVDGGVIPASLPEEAKPVLGLRIEVHTSPPPATAAAAADVHRRVLARRIAASGRTHGEICGEIGWAEPRLRRLLDRRGAMEFVDLLTVLETLGVPRGEYFEEVCRELAEVESGRGKR